MRKKVFSLVVLTALFLSGCKGGKESNTSNPTPSESEHVPVSPSEKPRPSESTSSGGNQSQSSASESTSTDVYSGWSKEIREYLNLYLNGQTVPYVNLGKASLISYERIAPNFDNNYDDYHIELDGTVDYTDTLKNKFAADYTSAGYQVSDVGTKKYAKKEDSHLTVTLEASDNGGVALRKIYYDEPYDKSKFVSYPSEIDSVLDSVFGTHKADIPVIYLGTSAPDYKDGGSRLGKSLILTGRKWNSAVLTDAKDVLASKGFTTSDTDEDTVNGSLTFSDGYQLVVTIEKITPSESKIPAYPQRTILRKEPYNPSTFTAWPSDIADLLSDYYGGHTLPLFYLGTDSPSVTYTDDDSREEFDVEGGAWDDRVRDNALNVLKNAGYAEDKDEEESSGYDNVLVRTKTEDGDKLKIVLYKNYNGIVSVEVHCTLAFGDPTSVTEYSQDVKSAFISNCGGRIPPFVYLGKRRTVDGQGDNYVELKGGTYKETARTNALNVLQNLNYTEDTEAEEDSSDDNVLVRVSPRDEKTSTKWNFTFYSYDDKIYGKWELIQSYNPNDTSTSYPQDVLDNIAKNLNGIDLPYVYLGTGVPSATWNSYSSDVVITGGRWDDAIVTKAKEAYTAKGWTEVAGAKSDDVSFIRHDKAKGFYYSRIYKNAGTPIVDVFYLPWKTETAYSSGISAQIKSWFYDKTEVPYVYLGEDSQLSLDSKDGSVTLTGSIPSRTALKYLFKTAYSEKGWMVTETDGDLIATKEADGYSFKVTLDEAYNSESVKVARLTFDAKAPYNPSEKNADYTDDEKKTIHAALNNNDIPRLYLGGKNYTLETGTTIGTWSKGITIYGGDYDSKVLSDNKKTLEENGFTVYATKEGERNHFGAGNTSFASLQGYKPLGSSAADGYLRFLLTKDEDSGKAVAIFFYDAATALDNTGTGKNKWNENTKYVGYRTNGLGGTILPYIDFATDDVARTQSVDEDENPIGIQINATYSNVGEVSHQAVARNVYNQLKTADPTIAITSYDFSYDNYGRSLEFVGTAKDGNKITYTLTCAKNSVILRAVYSEAFKVGEATSWSEDIQNARKKQLNQNLVPYFSLGTDSITIDDSREGTLVLKGKTWDKKVLDLCSAALAKETGWNYSDDGESRLLAKKVRENGTIYLRLEKKDNSPCLTIRYVAK